jgi:transcriptional regulator with XRE-family HTH domain
VKALGLKVRSFAQTLGVSETTVRNYTERGSEPSAELLENIINHFSNKVLSFYSLAKVSRSFYLLMKTIRQVEHRKAQLAMKDTLLTLQEETLALLRITYNRPT